MGATIIGTGRMARGIATRLLAGGHSVTLMGRDPKKAGDLAAELSLAAKRGAVVQTAALGNPIADDVVLLAIWYPAAAQVVQQYGAQLAGKVLVDITNPLNASFDELAVAADTSAAEEIAKVAPPGTKVVKAFNTTFARTLASGQVGGYPLDVFIAGDDVKAKATVAQLVTDGGLRAIDVGPLRRARQLEGMELLMMTLQRPMGTGYMSSLKILS
jgi:8-hydroxy-5-deazaflavin:NADPH oxidoreductase